LIHIVLNNGVNESVGGQPSAGQIVHLTQVAKACGYSTLGKELSTKGELQDAVRTLPDGISPAFFDVFVRQGIRKDMPKLSINHQSDKKSLMENLLKDE